MSFNSYFFCRFTNVLYSLLILVSLFPSKSNITLIKANHVNNITKNGIDSRKEFQKAPILTISDTTKYGFEKDTKGWRIQTDNGKAIVSIMKSDSGIAKYGHHSLKLNVHLVGGDSSLSKGEVYTDVTYHPNYGHLGKLNLEGKEITCWIFAPKGAIGQYSEPNGVQIFVKDVNFKSQYSTWYRIKENKWFEVNFVPSRNKPKDGHIDESFDPTKIIIIGIKVGTAKNSIAEYKGPIYLDGFDWE